MSLRNLWVKALFRPRRLLCPLEAILRQAGLYRAGQSLEPVQEASESHSLLKMPYLITCMSNYPPVFFCCCFYLKLLKSRSGIHSPLCFNKSSK